MGKEAFEFEYTVPTLDWYTTKNVKIEWDDYLYFKLQYRFGQSYWLLGYQEKDGRIERKEVEIGEIGRGYIGDFVRWCEFSRGSKLIGVSAISTGMNITQIMREILELSEEGE